MTAFFLHHLLCLWMRIGASFGFRFYEPRGILSKVLFRVQLATDTARGRCRDSGSVGLRRGISYIVFYGNIVIVGIGIGVPEEARNHFQARQKVEREELPFVEKLVGRRCYGFLLWWMGGHLEFKFSGLWRRAYGVA